VAKSQGNIITQLFVVTVRCNGFLFPLLEERKAERGEEKFVRSWRLKCRSRCLNSRSDIFHSGVNLTKKRHVPASDLIDVADGPTAFPVNTRLIRVTVLEWIGTPQVVSSS